MGALPDTTSTRDVGVSLIESIVAIGLLAGVLVSIAGLFVLAGRQVTGSRNSSVALCHARAMVEELRSLGFRQQYRWAAGAACVPAVETTCRIGSRTAAAVAHWQAGLAAQLARSHAEIEFNAVDGPTLQTGRAVRIRVTVVWYEGPRRRSLSL